jgi:hypothetical protein
MLILSSRLNAETHSSHYYALNYNLLVLDQTNHRSGFLEMIYPKPCLILNLRAKLWPMIKHLGQDTHLTHKGNNILNTCKGSLFYSIGGGDPSLPITRRTDISKTHSASESPGK